MEKDEFIRGAMVTIEQFPVSIVDNFRMLLTRSWDLGYELGHSRGQADATRKESSKDEEAK